MAEDIDDLLDEVESKYCKNSAPTKKINACEASRYGLDSRMLSLKSSYFIKMSIRFTMQLCLG